MKLSRPAPLLLLVLCSGCMPAVSHGPRVQPGPSTALTAAFTAGPRYGSGDVGNQPFLYGPVGISAAYGWTPDASAAPGYRLGVHVPVPAFALAQADLYLQLPPAWTRVFDAGVGVNVGLYQAMPYVQLGRIQADGSGWYTTQGVTLLRPAGYASNALWGWAWLPTLGYQMPGNGRTFHMFVTGGYGQEYGSCVYECSRTAEERYLLAAGVMLEFHRRRKAAEQPRQ